MPRACTRAPNLLPLSQAFLSGRQVTLPGQRHACADRVGSDQDGSCGGHHHKHTVQGHVGCGCGQLQFSGHSGGGRWSQGEEPSPQGLQESNEGRGRVSCRVRRYGPVRQSECSGFNTRGLGALEPGQRNSAATRRRSGCHEAPERLRAAALPALTSFSCCQRTGPGRASRPPSPACAPQPSAHPAAGQEWSPHCGGQAHAASWGR